MSIPRILAALAAAATAALLFTAVGWHWALAAVLLGVALVVAWPLLRLLVRGR